jgi:hypothetical protein
MSSAIPWVGRTSDAVVVFDPDIQVRESEFVLLWNVSNGELEGYVAKGLRETVKREGSESTAVDVRAKYSLWRSRSAEVIEEQRSYLAQRLKLEQRQAEEKRARLERVAEEKRAQLEREVKEAAERERIARMTPEERHARFLEERSLPNNAVRRRAPGKQHRVAICWSSTEANGSFPPETVSRRLPSTITDGRTWPVKGQRPSNTVCTIKSRLRHVTSSK